MTLTHQTYILSQVPPAPSSRPSLEDNAVPRHDSSHLRFIAVRAESVRCGHTRNPRVLFEQHSYPRRVSHNQRRQTSWYRSKVVHCCNCSQEINLMPRLVFALGSIRDPLYVSSYLPSLERGAVFAVPTTTHSIDFWISHREMSVSKSLPAFTGQSFTVRLWFTFDNTAKYSV